MSVAADQFDPAGFAMPARSEKEFLRQYVPQDDDSTARVYFFKKSVFQPFESQEKGREIYRDVDYVSIRIAGNDKLEHIAPVKDEDKRRFPFAWQQYTNGLAQSAQGVALTEVGIEPSQQMGFYSRNIFTCEDLVNVSDQALQGLPPGTRELRHKAREILKARAAAGTQSDTIKKLEQQLVESQKQIGLLSAELTKALAALEEKAERKGKAKE